MMEFGIEQIPERLPKEGLPVKIKASSYYMNNREIFINFINSVFEPYREALLDVSKEISCDTKTDEFFLMTHQEIVRDYINLYTPYRGLLIYHGLGAGKTCASIAIAEGIKNSKQIIIMTPASLRRNYINELKMCGDPLYRLNQYWEFIETHGNSQLESALANTLSITSSFIKKQGGVWFVDISKPPNLNSLTSEQRFQLNEQINEMIIRI